MSAEQLVDALYAFTDCEVTIASRIVVIRNNRPVEMTVSEVLRENTAQLVETLKRELELKEAKLQDELHFRTLERIFIEERIYKKIEQCKTNEAVLAAVHEGFKPFRKQMIRELTDPDVERLLTVRIRRISLFDINKHREEMEKVKGDLAETRKNLKNLTKYVIGHLEELLAKYGPLYPRLTKSSRYDEVDAKEVAFKAFKVAYDRESRLRRLQGLRRGVQRRVHEVRQADPRLQGRPLPGDRAAGEVLRRPGPGAIAACRSATGSSRSPTRIARRRI